MTIEQIMSSIKREKEIPSRFPVRVILINSLSQYMRLVEELKLISEQVVRLSEYCDAEDIFPSLDRLKRDIQSSSSSCILVLSMAEYLRLGYRRELPGSSPQFAGLFNMQQDSTSHKKVFVPLYACEQIFERVIGKLDERHREHVWRIDCTDFEEQFVLNVYSKEFENVLQTEHVIKGMKEWLWLWDKGISGTRHYLVTKLHPHAENAFGIYSISKIISIFEYIVNGLEDGNRLKQEWGTDENWKYFSTFINSSHSIAEVINKAHNMAEFDALSVLAKWNYIDDNKRWMFWLWYQLNTNNDYISFAVSTTKHFNMVPQAIRNAVFTMPVQKEKEWLEERKKAIELLKFKNVDDEFLGLVNQIPDKKKRLRLLNYDLHEERVYALKTLSQLLHEGVSIDEVIRIIEDNYSLLCKYIKPEWSYEWKQLDEYFCIYKKLKLENMYSDEINIYLEKTYTILENIDTRYSIIKKFASESDNTFVLWVDGLGAEWSSLLLSQILLLDPEIKYNIATGRAMLPTETEINNQWNDLGYPYKKLERLDKLSHKGDPDDQDYYSCIAKQLEMISDISKQVLSSFSDYDYDAVIVTGDHGTSRLAALAFHCLTSVNPPATATPRSFGRYCEMKGEIKQSDIHPSTKRVNNYLVFRTHEHYKFSGNAAGMNDSEIATAGEIHGGMTPEEMLVPVIALYKKQKGAVIKVNYTVVCTHVQPNANNEIELILNFDSKVNIVRVFSENKEAICKSNDGVEWRVTFENLSFGEHIIDVYADNKLLDKHESFTVMTRGLIIDDDL